MKALLITSLTAVGIFLTSYSIDKNKKVVSIQLLDTVVNVNPFLTKTIEDTLRMTTTYQIKSLRLYYKNRNYFFQEKDGVCKKEKNSIRVYLEENIGNTTFNRMDLSIKNGTYKVKAEVDQDDDNPHIYIPVSQKLTLNKSDFKQGDTMIGDISYTGVFKWSYPEQHNDQIYSKDTLFINGKFKLIVK